MSDRRCAHAVHRRNSASLKASLSSRPTSGGPGVLGLDARRTTSRARTGRPPRDGRAIACACHSSLRGSQMSSAPHIATKSPRASAKARVECRRAAAVGLAHDANPVGEPLELACGAIGGAVIDDHDLVGRARLAEDRLQRLGDPLLGLVGRYDGRDGRSDCGGMPLNQRTVPRDSPVLAAALVGSGAGEGVSRAENRRVSGPLTGHGCHHHAR